MIIKPLITSFKKLRITLLWPLVLSTLNIILFSILFIITSGIWKYFINQPPSFEQDAVLTLVQWAKTFLAENAVKTILSFVIFFTIYFVIGAGITAIRYGMIKDILEGKEQKIFKGLFKALPYAKTHFIKVIGMKILTFITQIALIGLFVYLFIPNTSAQLGTTAKIVFFIILILLSLFLALAMLFRYAYLFFTKDNPLVCYYHSISFFFNRPGYTFLVVLTITIAALIRTGIQEITKETTLASIGIIIVTLYSIFFIIWQEVFIFSAFKHRLLKNH